MSELTPAHLTPGALVRRGGCDYEIICVAVQIDPPTQLVIFKDLLFEQPWARPLPDFLRHFVPAQTAEIREVTR